MSNLNLFKKTLIILIVLPLWVNSYAGNHANSFSVNFDNNNSLDLGNMKTATSLGFNVRCVSPGNGNNGNSPLSDCSGYSLSLSSPNNPPRLIHNLNSNYSIDYSAIITSSGKLIENGKTYTSQILVTPASFPVSQRAGIYADTLTLSVSVP